MLFGKVIRYKKYKYLQLEGIWFILISQITGLPFQNLMQGMGAGSKACSTVAQRKPLVPAMIYYKPLAERWHAPYPATLSASRSD